MTQQPGLQAWAARWNVPAAALADLRAALVLIDEQPVTPAQGDSEAAVQARVRVAASKAGMRVWRNNLGVFSDPDRGVYVRYGLANDTPGVNKVLKSADLIGIRPHIVQPGDVGTLIGRFVSWEVKHAGWSYRGDEHEQAQMNWAMLVRQFGGEARFLTSATQV